MIGLVAPARLAVPPAVGGHLTVATGAWEATPGEWAHGITECYLPDLRLLTRGVPTKLGIWHEAGHEEPRSIAMGWVPTQAAVRNDGTRWVIEPTFSDFKSRGFQREDTPSQAPDRWDRLILIRTLARDGCMSVGRHDVLYHPTSLEKAQAQTDPHHWSAKKVWHSLSWFKRGLRLLLGRLQTHQPLLAFFGEIIRN